MAKEEKNRTRNIQKTIWVTDDEHELIKKKMELSGYNSFNEYIVRMGIDGFIILQDYQNFIEVSQMLTEIGKDINKIAHRVDIIELQEEKRKRGEEVQEVENPISINDIAKIDKHMENIWNTLNEILKMQSGSNIIKKERAKLKRKINKEKKNNECS